MFDGFMEQEVKNDLTVAWNEVEETITSLTDLPDEDIITLKETLLMRLRSALGLLGKYVTDEDLQDIGIV